MPAPSRAIVRRALGDARVRTVSFAILFAVVAVVQAVGYRRSYPDLAERMAFARNFGDNNAIRLFYGVPHDLVTTGGYVAWRVGGTLAIFAAVWGLLSAVAAFRGQEESGRLELVLAGIVTRRRFFVATLGAIGIGAVVLGVALFAGLAAARLPMGPSAYLAVATLSPLVVFAGVGALTSQIAPTRRLALEAGAAVLVAAFLLRVVSDTAARLDWLRWTTPLGWAEEARPFAEPRPAVLLLPALATALLLVVAARLAMRRDIGSGLLPSRDSASPRLHLLSSPTALALRSETGGLVTWLIGVGFFAVIIGLLSDSFSNATISTRLQNQIQNIGGASIVTPSGALGLYFLFFVLAISLFAVSQIAVARGEEAGGRLETLLALPVGRRSWLGGRLALAAVASAVLAFTAGVLAWAGAASQGADVSLARMLEAGANCLPASLLFLGLSALAFALLPRAASALSYGLVSVAFVWELVGALLGVPAWCLALSPFHNVALVPAQPLKGTAALAMLAIAAVCAAVAIGAFERRDVVTG